jgi:hypothetical protein
MKPRFRLQLSQEYYAFIKCSGKQFSGAAKGRRA